MYVSVFLSVVSCFSQFMERILASFSPFGVRKSVRVWLGFAIFFIKLGVVICNRRVTVCIVSICNFNTSSRKSFKLCRNESDHF